MYLPRHALAADGIDITTALKSLFFANALDFTESIGHLPDICAISEVNAMSGPMKDFPMAVSEISRWHDMQVGLARVSHSRHPRRTKVMHVAYTRGQTQLPQNCVVGAECEVRSPSRVCSRFDAFPFSLYTLPASFSCLFLRIHHSIRP